MSTVLEFAAHPPIWVAFVCFSLAILIAVGLGLTGRKESDR